jgi:tetratricopeptide (TPR) repeat protein
MYRARARQWSRLVWALALLFGSLPVAGRLILGSWGFSGSAEISCLLLLLGGYFHLASRGVSKLSDPAMLLDEANQLAASGQIERATALLTKTIRLSPRFWQAFQYRGELYLGSGKVEPAFRDFSEAIRLAPNEPHLYQLRVRAYSLLPDKTSFQDDTHA